MQFINRLTVFILFRRAKPLIQSWLMEMALEYTHVRSFCGVGCDTDNYLMIAKVREILAISKQAAQTFDEERFSLRKLRELEVRKQYQIKISNMFAALENPSDNKGINRAA